MKHHSKKEINAAIDDAIKCGWTWTLSKGHPAGILKCNHKNKCHRLSIPSTPANTGAWAKRIRKKIEECK